MPAHINRKKIRDIARRAARAVEKGIEYTAEDLWGNVIENSPVNHGRLSGSWQLRRLGVLQYMVYTAVKYARWVNDGTGEYVGKGRITTGKPGKVITAKKGKALAFSVGGTTIFAKSVEQPMKPMVFKKGGKTIFAMSIKGMKGRKYIEKSISQTEKRKAEFVETALEEVGLI